MRVKTLALAGLAALSVTACASSGNSGTTRDPIRALLSGDAMMFVGFDSNGDLNTSREELEAGISREFARIDSNSDAAISPSEYQNWANAVFGGGQMGPYRLDFDRNVDNTITREEFEAEVRARFSDYDENGDNRVTRGEMVRLVGAARPPTQAREPMQPMR
jgi:Ca2+-binding EF-hand superfamily protein